MKRLSIFLSTIFLLIGIFAGCSAMGVAPVTGFLYTDIKAPVTATSNTSYTKIGTASCNSILGLIATGDASIEAACKSVGITKIHHVDYHTTNILGIIATFKVYVYGD
ncbi:MAG: TRL-like family protein [Candidatus Kapaibacteriota bacterium]